MMKRIAKTTTPDLKVFQPPITVATVPERWASAESNVNRVAGWGWADHAAYAGPNHPVLSLFARTGMGGQSGYRPDLSCGRIYRAGPFGPQWTGTIESLHEYLTDSDERKALDLPTLEYPPHVRIDGRIVFASWPDRLRSFNPRKGYVPTERVTSAKGEGAEANRLLDRDNGKGSGPLIYNHRDRYAKSVFRDCIRTPYGFGDADMLAPQTDKADSLWVCGIDGRTPPFIPDIPSSVWHSIIPAIIAIGKGTVKGKRGKGWTRGRPRTGKQTTNRLVHFEALRSDRASRGSVEECYANFAILMFANLDRLRFVIRGEAFDMDDNTEWYLTLPREAVEAQTIMIEWSDLIRWCLSVCGRLTGRILNPHPITLKGRDEVSRMVGGLSHKTASGTPAALRKWRKRGEAIIADYAATYFARLATKQEGWTDDPDTFPDNTDPARIVSMREERDIRHTTIGRAWHSLTAGDKAMAMRAIRDGKQIMGRSYTRDRIRKRIVKSVWGERVLKPFEGRNAIRD